jgi:OPT family oligopeptide transporter
MAPDRGIAAPMMEDMDQSSNSETTNVARLAAAKCQDARNFTLRGLLVGLLIGTVVCFSNMYFGLQTGWVSSMAMPSALLGFSYFKMVSRYISFPFTPIENVFVQSVAGSVGTMPLGCGFVGVLPALNYLLTPDENGPLQISLIKLIIWAVGIAFFGVVFAVPLRKQVIIREKLRFPSGTATASLIEVLHGKKGPMLINQASSETLNPDAANHNADRIYEDTTSGDEPSTPLHSMDSSVSARERMDVQVDWGARIRILAYSFGFSALYVSYCPILLLAVLFAQSIRRRSFRISYL